MPNIRVLLAEDDDDMRQVINALLAEDGYEVVLARDGSDALDTLSKSSHAPLDLPDVIIMDVRMPGCSGLHVLAALRHAGWGTPIILITAFGDERVHREAARLGASMLDKPFHLDDLRVLVVEALGRTS